MLDNFLFVLTALSLSPFIETASTYKDTANARKMQGLLKVESQEVKPKEIIV